MVSGQRKREVGGGWGEGNPNVHGESGGALLSAECTNGGMFF